MQKAYQQKEHVALAIVCLDDIGLKTLDHSVHVSQHTEIECHFFTDWEVFDSDSVDGTA
jgi:hypothetical protein